MTDPAFEALARRNRELEALNAVSATIGRGADLESTAGDALDVVLGLTGMRVGCVFRKDAAIDGLVLVAHRGLDAAVAGTLGVRPLQGNRAGDTPPFTDDDLAMVADFASRATVAVENARLFGEARGRAAEYRALFEVAGIISSTLDVQRVLDVIVERCRALLDVGGAGIFRFDAERDALVYERGIGLSTEFIESVVIRPGVRTVLTKPLDMQETLALLARLRRSE